MNVRMKTIVAASALSLGLAAVPASAQVVGGAQTFGYSNGNRAPGYNEDGTLNVFGAHLDPRAARGPGLIGGVTGAVGGVVDGVVGGATGAAEDLTTGSIDDQYDQPAYGRRTAY